MAVTASEATSDDPVVHILWVNAGLSCDGGSVALTAATQPTIEEIALGALPGLPEVAVHWPLIDFESGPIGGADEGCWCGFGTDPETGQPITTSEWLDRLAPKALAVPAAGTCAAYGGIHAMQGNPTGAMGVPDYLGWGWTSKAGLPIVCVPGCPTHPDNLSDAR